MATPTGGGGLCAGKELRGRLSAEAALADGMTC